MNARRSFLSSITTTGKIKNGYQSTYARMNPGKNGILSSSGRYDTQQPSVVETMRSARANQIR